MAVFRRVPGKQEGKKGPVGPTVRPRLAEKENHTLSFQPCVPASPPGPGVQPASPLLGLQGLLLAPGLVPGGWGVDVSCGRGRHLCHGLLGSWLLVRGPSLCFPPFGPSVLEPNLNPRWKPTPNGGKKSDRRRELELKPKCPVPVPWLTVHLAAGAQEHSLLSPKVYQNRTL